MKTERKNPKRVKAAKRAWKKRNNLLVTKAINRGIEQGLIT